MAKATKTSARKAVSPARAPAKGGASSKAKAKTKAAPTKAAMRMPPLDPEIISLLDETLSHHPDLRAGKMFGCPAYFVGAKAVGCVFGDEMSLTLPPAKIDELVARPGFRRFQARGRTMSGWILLDKKRAATLARDVTLVEQAIAYARSKAAR